MASAFHAAREGSERWNSIQVRCRGNFAPPMIQMFHVTKAYPGDPPVLVDINLDVQKGEFVFLTGPSGAGKSTLLKLMFVAERPSRGQVLISGRNVARLRSGGIPY